MMTTITIDIKQEDDVDAGCVLPVSNGPDRREHKHIGRDPEETRDTVALQRDNDHQALRF